MNLIDYLHCQRVWSEATFGPGENTDGLIRHIVKELHEVLSADTNEEKIAEFVDVLILAFDGAMRLGATPEQVAFALNQKQGVNMRRKWPDWRTAEPGQPIEHIRGSDDEPLPQKGG